MAKVTYETYYIENTWLQGWGCPEQAIMASQRQVSEDLIYRELSNKLVHTLFSAEYMYFWKVLKVLPQFTIHKCLKVNIPYPISSSKPCTDDTERGLMVNHINYNTACFPRYMRFNFSTAACSHAQDNFSQSCTTSH